MHKREDPPDTRYSVLALLLFVLSLLVMYSQWWRTQTEILGWVAVPLTPWAVSGLLTAAAWGGIAYYAAALSMHKLYKWMIRLPVGAALLPAAAYVLVLLNGDSPDMNGVLSFCLFAMLLPYYALYVLFYIPLAGLVRLVPFLGTRMANSYVLYDGPMAPIATIAICLMYLSVSIVCHALGRKAQTRTRPCPRQNEPADIPEAGCTGQSPAAMGEEQNGGGATAKAPEPVSDKTACRVMSTWEKNRAVLSIIALGAAMLFFVLWVAEGQDKSQFAALVVSNAAAAYEGFEDYQVTLRESDYWTAVADFAAFEQSLRLLFGEDGAKEEVAVCGEVYKLLISNPDNAMRHAGALALSLYSFCEDIRYEYKLALMLDRMTALRDALVSP
ncbi:MAG TPA: hypothetical protein VN446_00510 [Candidatus Acidoferrum sp.]|nr:hypothetical protein [Candidatus Acidoferrum sp.]